MTAFNVSKIGDMAENFIRRDKRLNYSLSRMETERNHILFKAENLFSSLYCQVTNDVEIIRSWVELQRKLYQERKTRRNQYLVYIIPEIVVRENDLYEELSLAERNVLFFRKIFIDIPENYNTRNVEKSLSNRLPIWISDKGKVLREYIPLVEDIIPNVELRLLLASKKAPAIVDEIEEREKYSWLFSEDFANRQTKQKQFMSPTKKDLAFETSRIKSLELKDFRCFKSAKIDLDSDVVIIYGENGRGKTSIVDAIEFSMFNRVQRLEYDPDIESKSERRYSALINSESTASEARINLTGVSKGDIFRIETKIRNNECIAFLNDKRVDDKDIIAFLTDNEELTKREEYLDIVLHTYFLGQHSIRDFIYGTNSRDENEVRTNRYDLISEMFGFGKVETLRHRLADVSRNIKLRKINVFDNLIKGCRANLRSIGRKYGPKTRSEVEKRGYKIDQEYAIAAYKDLLDKVRNELGLRIDDSIMNCRLPIANYMVACDILVKMLDNQVKEQKTREREINKINRFYIKINSILTSLHINVLADSFLDYIDKVRNVIKKEIKTIEESKCEIAKIDNEIQQLEQNRNALNDFRTRFEEFNDLSIKEKALREKVAELEKENNAFLAKKELLEEKLLNRGKKRNEMKEQIAKLENNIRHYLLIKTKLRDLKIKNVQFKRNTETISKIDLVIDQYKEEIEHLIQTTDLGEEERALISNILERTNYFGLKNEYACPCCGQLYSHKNELNENIIKQITDGRYRSGLRDFIFDIHRKHGQLTVKEKHNFIRRKVEEKANLEKENSSIEKEITEFEELLIRTCKKKTVTEGEIQELLNKSNSQMSELKNRIDQYNTDSIENKIRRVTENISSLNYVHYKRKHEEMEGAISGMIKDTITIIPENEIFLKNIDSMIVQIEEDLKKHRGELARFQMLLQDRTILQQRANEIDEHLVEMEALIHKYNLSHRYSVEDGIVFSRVDVSLQQKYYEMLSQIKDLNILFGLITAKEESENIRNSIKKYDAEKKRWTTCYMNFRKLNEELSSLSYSGLKRSLDQYSPLINEMYKKFIRHEYFNEVQFKPVASRKMKKRNLYILLKNYAGKTDYTPSSYLSEAQLNILALSIFLARAIYQNISIFETVLIDDPVQQMDQMNTVSFIDIILGLSQIGKQVIITTCDSDFFDLFRQKLAEVSVGGPRKFRAINLEDECKKINSSVPN